MGIWKGWIRGICDGNNGGFGWCNIVGVQSVDWVGDAKQVGHNEWMEKGLTGYGRSKRGLLVESMIVKNVGISYCRARTGEVEREWSWSNSGFVQNEGYNQVGKRLNRQACKILAKELELGRFFGMKGSCRLPSGYPQVHWWRILREEVR